jgi:hypothetical protein
MHKANFTFAIFIKLNLKADAPENICTQCSLSKLC